ncbi:hypothetical protein [Treponema pedis]|uniref:hypothetical protein n=1 Tax=Treponema pedis TaxID=409322 RepID=UPI00046327F6|nr:hypothetical protein [Treponema pedis]QSI04902.1 hypothetical protein DYQ05_08170 [Treponema pedis]
MNRHIARVCFYIALIACLILIVLCIIEYRGSAILYYLLGTIMGGCMFPSFYLDFQDDRDNDKILPSTIKGLVAAILIFLICFFMLIKTLFG